MSIFGVKEDFYDGSGICTFINYATNHYLSIDRHGSVSTVSVGSNKISKNETLSLVAKRDSKDPSKDDMSFYIRSYYGHYLTFDVSDNKLYCQKVSHSITSWRKHASQLYARFSATALFYFSPASTAGIIGASGISLYGNKYLCVDGNGSVSSKIIPGKREMWIITFIQQNVSKTPGGPISAESKENDEKKSNFEEKLFTISNLVRSNSKALDIYKEQIKNNTIKVNSMKEWDKLYQRIVMKEYQWSLHKNELKRNKKDLVPLLESKYDEKYAELQECKEIILGEQTNLNAMNKAKDLSNLMIKKYKNEIDEYGVEINELENKINALKIKKLNCLNRINNEIKPKLKNQCECITDSMNEVNKLNMKANNFEKELTSIQETKYGINKFETDIYFILNYLENQFKNEFEVKWMEWDSNDIIIWLTFLNNFFKENDKFTFKNDGNKKLLMDGVVASNLNGKDLRNVTDLILRSFDIQEKEDREMILKCLKTLMSEMDNEDNGNVTSNVNMNDNDNKIEDEVEQDRQCVVCMDNVANMMFMPCNHIAICQDCYKCNTFDNKCAFCGNKTNKVIKCYHVGF